jgi:hypothetical protein
MKQKWPQRKSLFWDTDPKALDPKRHAEYMIERILDVGNDVEVQWMFKQYPMQRIRKVMHNPRVQMHQKSRALWQLILQ